MQPGGRVKPLAIPAQQASDRERVAQAVQPWCGHSGGRREPQRACQLSERSAGGLPGDARVPVEGEQRRVVIKPPASGATLELLVDQRAYPWAVRDQAALAELAALDDQQLAAAINVADAQRARLTAAQSKPVAEREDRAIARPAVRGARAIRERAGGIQQPRACVVSRMNGIRVAVTRRRRVCNGERSSSSCATAQSSRQPTTPSR